MKHPNGMRVFALALMNIILIIMFAQPTAAGRELLQATSSIRICVPAATSPEVLSTCTQAVAAANNATLGLTFSCVEGGSPEICMDKINKGDAELTSFGAAEVYTAKTEYDLEPILAELYGNSTSPTEYFSVAVVTKEFCDTNPSPSFQALRGKRSCHTGYRKTAGWVAPVGLLVDSEVVPVVATEPGVQPDAQSVASFFSQVCAPRVTADGPAAGGLKWDPLCTGCAGDCGENDPYYDYSGAFRCLLEDAGDVAFTKQDTVPIYAADGSTPAEWATKNKDDFRLLCPNGGCQTVDAYEQCNMARVPSHAIVGEPTLQTSQLGRDIKEAFISAAADPAFIQALTEVGGLSNFVFAEGTTGLASQDQPFSIFFDPSLVASFRGLTTLQESQPASAPAPAPTSTPRPAVGATPTPAESSGQAVSTSTGEYKMCIPLAVGSEPSFLQKCNAAMAMANDVTLGVSFSCVQGESAQGCMQMIRDGRAQLTKFGPSDIALANRDYGLEPIVSENYGGDVGNEYYSVAVVRKEFCDADNVSPLSLKGKRSCHTGYRKTAGWFMPVGYLVDNDVLPIINDNPSVNADAETVAAFFSKTCAPRVTVDGPTVEGKRWDPLCSACGGDCGDDPATEPYYDYSGTVRGLMEDACDVAYTKQDTVPTVAKDGSAPESWSTMNQDDFRLLCPLGGCAKVSEYSTCNYAAVPSHAVVGPVDLQRTIEGANVKKALIQAAARSPNFLASATQIDGAESFIFTKNTKSLDAVDGSFVDYFGSGTLQAYQGIEFMEEAPPTSTGGGLSSGAIAGIVIGAVVGAVLLAGLVGVVIHRRTRQKYLKFEVDISKPIAVSGTPSEKL